MKIIFLDIDGVLNEDTAPTRTKSRIIFIDKEKLLPHLIKTEFGDGDLTAAHVQEALDLLLEEG